jgi:hypothetical protein
MTVWRTQLLKIGKRQAERQVLLQNPNEIRGEIKRQLAQAKERFCS